MYDEPKRKVDWKVWKCGVIFCLSTLKITNKRIKKRNKKVFSNLPYRLLETWCLQHIQHHLHSSILKNSLTEPQTQYLPCDSKTGTIQSSAICLLSMLQNTHVRFRFPFNLYVRFTYIGLFDNFLGSQNLKTRLTPYITSRDKIWGFIRIWICRFETSNIFATLGNLQRYNKLQSS